MSWWVKEIESITDDNLYRLCYIEADDTTLFPDPVQQKEVSDPDNPGQTIWVTDYTIVRGSKLYCLSNASWYKLNSLGQWILQTSGGGGGASSADQVSYDNTDSGLTATNVQDAIDELHDTDETQDNALVELYAENANQQLEINYAINTGSKNKLNLSLITQTVNGVTFTVNDDQTITVTGTPTTSFATTICYVSGLLGDYTLTGCPSGGSDSTYKMYRAGDSSQADYGDGYTYTFEPQNNHAIRIYLYSGNTFNNLTFKPMLRAAEIKSNTFEPYAPTNRELYETVQTKADKGSFNLTIAGSPLVTSEYSYSCIVTGDIATVCIRLVLADALDVNTSRNLFKIPTGYRPPQAVAGTGYADSKLRVFWINTSGDVKIRIDEAIPAGASINANFCYSYNPANWTTVTANQLQSLNSPLTLNLNRNELDSNFDLLDSIPEEEEGEEDDI